MEFPPSSGSAPQRTAGAGVRGGSSCIAAHPSPTLIALVPDDQVSLTTSSHPQFFIYIPSNSAQEGVFSLSLNGDVDAGYTQRLILSGKPGVIEISLPEEINLKLNQDYNWKFSLNCQDSTLASSLINNDPTVQGVVRRVELSRDLASKLAQVDAKSLGSADLYAQAGIWHEATAILYDLRESDPQQWTQWLGSVHLDSLSKDPSVLHGSPVLF
jgi:hypothetical protein